MNDNEVDRQRLKSALGAVAAQDRTAMRLIYDQTADKLFAVCLRVLKDTAAAEDTLQDVYLKVWHHAARFDASRASPITWLCSIARNTAIDRLRSSRRVPTGDGEVPDLIPDDAPTADVVLEQRQAQARMIDCIGLLDGDHARCIRAAFFDGHTYVQLADRHNVPLGTMKSWIRRGLLRLRECLDDA
ncbi:sigma-70 family RNA polymerase sigma factor [Sphingomonas sp. CFBP 13720]|uniref:sigma-70 family RNA polymerase sigma factor n=1 Tax=Sphingomonas sp. CFBP 13720 TaxID=2775302 RepID=UPI002017AB62|nr:sigma-70 family RNA polymerase sigma factor [Sphingomonas sp. CFBP 13720]